MASVNSKVGTCDNGIIHGGCSNAFLNRRCSAETYSQEASNSVGEVHV